MDKSAPLLTIITPTFNAASTIVRCMENVQQQTFKDFIHLIVDGVSSDETLSLIANFQGRNENIEVMSGKDKGVYDAMNKGIKVARSSWLFFLGSDDYFYTNTVLNDIAPLLQKRNSGILYGDVYYKKYGRIYDGYFDMEKILKRNICHQAVFYHSSVFETLGYYSLKYKTESDYHFHLRCWLKGEFEIVYFPLVVAYYSEGGISDHSRDRALVEDYPDIVLDAVLTSKRTFLEKVNLSSKVYRKIVQRYSLAYLPGYIFKTQFMAGRLLAFTWMVVSFPYHLITKKLVK
ncbi:MAG: glycosyltransferase [Chitinophagaceae bacterium]|nr:glycosyltransferase [Chitinophagaceae bacterium]